ncbi:hypothetical protein ACHCAL_17040 [Providencia huaxiensis]|uniref:hypothetical protein n=1 Tax=Providencia huaxiensis TaxID=2027290 RepID=UPI003757889E
MIMAETLELPSLVALGILVSCFFVFVYCHFMGQKDFLMLPACIGFVLSLSVFVTLRMLPTVNTDDTKQAKHYATECVLLEMGIPTQFGRMNKLKCHEVIEHVGTDSYQWHIALYEKLKHKGKV